MADPSAQKDGYRGGRRRLARLAARAERERPRHTRASLVTDVMRDPRRHERRRTGWSRQRRARCSCVGAAFADADGVVIGGGFRRWKHLIRGVGEYLTCAAAVRDRGCGGAGDTGVDVADPHARSARAERLRGGGADSAAAAGDDDDAAGGIRSAPHTGRSNSCRTLSPGMSAVSRPRSDPEHRWCGRCGDRRFLHVRSSDVERTAPPPRLSHRTLSNSSRRSSAARLIWWATVLVPPCRCS